MNWIYTFRQKSSEITARTLRYREFWLSAVFLVSETFIALTCTQNELSNINDFLKMIYFLATSAWCSGRLIGLPNIFYKFICLNFISTYISLIGLKLFLFLYLQLSTLDHSYERKTKTCKKTFQKHSQWGFGDFWEMTYFNFEPSKNI